MNANRIGVGLMMLLWPMAAAMADTVRATPKVTGSGAMRFGPYTYDGAGNIRTIGRDGGVQEVYQYDVLSRLTSATAEVTNTQSYTYDPFGNRVNAQRTNGSAECTGGSTCEQNAIPSRLTNHLPSPSTYDDAGNLTMGPGGGRYAYDAAGMMTRALTGAGERQFLYTADDERIATYEGSSSWTWTVRAGDGKVLREYTSTNDTATGNLGTKDRKWTTDYMWRDGQLLSTEKPGSGGTTERLDYHLDHLGTPRLITSGAGLKVSTHAYYAFGAELRVVGAAAESPETKMKFTGHERDLAGNSDMLDYMHARYYSSLQGRFLSIDPSLDSADPKVPQSWNRYSYTLNGPLKFIDPTGRNTTVTCTENTRCVARVDVQVVANPNDPAQAATANAYKQSTESYWNGRTERGLNGEVINFDFHVGIVAPGQQVAGLDTVTVVNGAGQSNIQMTLTPTVGSQVNPPDTGTLYTTDTTGNRSGMAGIGAHESGHLLGLRDMYLPGEVVGYNPSPAVDIMRYAQPTNGTPTAFMVLSIANLNKTVIHLEGPCPHQPCP